MKTERCFQLLAETFKAMSDPARTKIIFALCLENELCVGGDCRHHWYLHVSYLAPVEDIEKNESGEILQIWKRILLFHG